MAIPPSTISGDLPVGVHQASLSEVLARFGSRNPRRGVIASRLERVCKTAEATGHLARIIVFGSFVTTKPEPNDVDVFLLMEDTFDVAQIWGEARLLFEHMAAQARFGASVFWLRRSAAVDGELEAIEHWQVKRDGGRRGIVEILLE